MANIVKPKNRKIPSYSGEIKRGKIIYKVNAKKSGIYNLMLHKALDQLDICLNNWKRVLVVRFDLHQTFYTGDNKKCSDFVNKLKKGLKRQYTMPEIGYFWAREQEKAKSQHYHFVLYLDGNKVNHSKKVLEIVRATWTRKNQHNHVPVIKNPYYFIDNEQTKQEAVYRISYLAKARGKGYRDTQAKDYSTSRLIKHDKQTTGASIAII